MIYVKEKIYQWETEVEIATDYPSLLAFACAAYGELLEVETQKQNGKYVGYIPNILLQKPNNITVYAVDGSEKVRDVKLISVIYRAKPSDYVYTETEIKDYDTLAAQIEDIQEQIESIDVELPIASTDTLGGIKVGTNLTITSDGVLEAPYSAKGDKGDKGDSGEAGQDGYTPQRGVDYWTSADIAEIHEYIDENMPDGGSGSYTLPIASSSTLGGIKVGANLSITSDGVLSAIASSSGGGAASTVQPYRHIATYEYVEGSTATVKSITKDSSNNDIHLKKVLVVPHITSTSIKQIAISLRILDSSNQTIGAGSSEYNVIPIPSSKYAVIVDIDNEQKLFRIDTFATYIGNAYFPIETDSTHSYIAPMVSKDGDISTPSEITRITLGATSGSPTQYIALGEGDYIDVFGVDA